MKAKMIFQALALPALLCGCEHTLTYKVWHETEVTYFRPASNPELQLCEKTTLPADILVIYQELAEHNDTVRPRAFFLGANEARLARHRKPVFVDPGMAAGLRRLVILVVVSDTNLAPGSNAAPLRVPGASVSELHARLSPDGQSFTLIEHGKELGDYTLPVYADSRSRLKRVLLTPVGVAGDLTALGLIAGFFALVGMCQSGISFGT